MRMPTLEEHKKASAFLKEKCLKLWNIENTQNGIPRNIAQTGFPINLAYVQKISDDGEIIVFRNLSFLRHLDYCQTAIVNGDIKFEKGNAMIVLENMYNLSMEKQSNKSFEYYIDNVRTESCCYIIYKKEDAYDDRVLRADLFRKLDFENEKVDFSGGLFHALNHFTLDKADKKHRNFINDIEELMYYSAYAFFEGEDVPANTDKAIAKIIKNPKHKSSMKFVFFYEKDSNVSFIETIMTLRK